MRNALIFTIFLCFALEMNVHAQFNVKVGYALAYTPANTTNSLIGQFNNVFDTQSIAGDPMKDLQFLHGLSVGVRWKYEFVSWELEWENLSRSREAVGEFPTTDEPFSEKYYFTVNSIGTSIESIFGRFGIGVGAGRRQFRIKEDSANFDRRRDVLLDKPNQYYVKPFIAIHLGGGSQVGFAIKPYINIPLTNVDITDLAEDMNLRPGVQVDNPTEKESLWLFGVHFTFYNGFQ